MRRQNAITLVAIGAFLTLAVVAWYQYRWIERVAAADRERVEFELNDSLSAFAHDFEREIASATVSIRILDGTVVGQPSERPFWEYRTLGPQLVRGVYFVESSSTEQFRLLRIEPDSARPEPVPWPGDWSEFRTMLLAESSRATVGVLVPWHVVPDVPALVRLVGNGVPMAAKKGPVRLPRGFLIVAIDSAYLQQHLFPTLTQRHFHGDGQGTYHIQVRFQSDDSRIIYDSAPTRAFSATTEKTIPILRTGWINGNRPMDDPSLLSSGGAWQLAVTRENSLTPSLIERFRARSLAISGVSLLILAAALVTLFLAMRRARGLAHTRWEFVSGVSHELRTPVAALRSIAENMSDGVVAPGRIPRYGKLITVQVERLSEMVEDVLEFGRSQRADEDETDQSTDVGAVISEALAAHASALEGQGFQVVKDVPANFPAARCSATALRRAIQNLLSNAIKYDAGARWVRIVACVGAEGQIAISVEDRGRGIPRNERERIFEPFFRGRDVRAGQLPGAGLGLSVAKRSIELAGGRIAVESEPGQGARFTVFLHIAQRT